MQACSTLSSQALTTRRPAEHSIGATHKALHPTNQPDSSAYHFGYLNAAPQHRLIWDADLVLSRQTDATYVLASLFNLAAMLRRQMLYTPSVGIEMHIRGALTRD